MKLLVFTCNFVNGLALISLTIKYLFIVSLAILTLFMVSLTIYSLDTVGLTINYLFFGLFDHFYFTHG